MKKAFICAVIGIIFLGVLSTGILAFDNEPAGFRGLKWGTTAKANMTKVGEFTCMRSYVRASDKLWLGEAALTRITYQFFVVGYREKLFSVCLWFDNEISYLTLANICREKFGEPTSEKILNEMTWQSDKTQVSLDYSNISKKGSLLMVDVALLKIYSAEKARRQGKEAEQDW